MATIDLVINAQTKAATQALTSFGKAGANAFKGISSAATGLKVLAAGAVAFLGGRAIINQIGDFVKSAAEAEESVNKLNTALKLSGQFTKETSDDIVKFADSLQSQTRFSDDAILANAALIQSLGRLSGSGLKDATKAAVDLSAALGIDLASAATLVGKAAAGNVTALSRYGIEIRKGTSDAATFANALGQINARFGGAAAAQVNTFAGAIDQLANSQDNLNEELGFTITKNPGVIAGIKTLSSVFSKLVDIVIENRDQISDYITKGITAFVNVIPSGIQKLKSLVSAFTILKAVALDVASAVLGVGEALLTFAKKPSDSISEAVNLLTSSDNILKLQQLENQLKTAKEGIVIFGKVLQRPQPAATIAAAEKRYFDFLNKIRENPLTPVVDLGLDDAAKKIGDLSDRLAQLRNDAVIDDEKNAAVFDKLTLEAEKLGESFKKSVNDAKAAAAAPTVIKPIVETSFFDKLKSGFSFVADFFGGKLAEEVDPLLALIGKGLGAVLSDGTKAAASAAAGIGSLGAEGVGMMFGVPGVGQALAPVFEAATAGPEQTKAMVTAFAEALPDMIVNMVEALIEALPLLIDKLVDVLITQGGLVRIVDALVRAMPRVALALAEALVRALFVIINTAFQELSRLKFTDLREAFNEFLTKLSTFFGNFLISIANALSNIGPSIYNSMISFLNKFTEKLNQFIDAITPGSGGTFNPINQLFGSGTSESLVGKLTKFQTGGIVSGTGPAFVHQGELVVPPDTTSKLFSLIDSMAADGGGRENGVVMAALAEILGTLRQPMTIETKAQVNGDTFADIILKLDRRNARTAA